MVNILSIANIIGSSAFALTGFMIGVKKRLDWVGIFTLAMLTANGGGVTRDLLVGRTPSLMKTPWPFITIILTLVMASIFRIHHRLDKIEQNLIFVSTDAIGLVAFSLTGSLVGIAYDFSIFGVITLAFTSAVGGGIIRDLMVNEIPFALQGEPYAAFALLIGIIIYCLNALQINYPALMLITCVFAGIMRVIAYKNHWKIPGLNPPSPPSKQQEQN